MRESTKTTKTRDLVLCSIFIALITVGAYIKIPSPIVPFTLQTIFTNLAGLVLGSKLGFMAVIGYVILGLLGVPVFTGGGGIGYVLQPSFGYLIGFAVGAFVIGKIHEHYRRNNFQFLLFCNVVGLICVYICGMLYYVLLSKFYLGNSIGLLSLFFYFCIIFIPSDLVMCVVSSYLAKVLIDLKLGR
ncbi:MAG: biotin transporter BioY [Synergistaceae bacterium]|nr:biotin transporter BioY [Synergistaceae bacterium]